MAKKTPDPFKLLLVLLALAITGCGDGKISVSGSVSVVGQPIDRGAIRFEPADGKGPTDGSPIQAGRYSTQLAPGQKKVHIEGHKQVGEAKQNPDDPSSPILPVHHKILDTEVTAEVSTSRNDLDFDLPAP